jgi:Kef-type K+ transport system membrane component KefB
VIALLFLLKMVTKSVAVWPTAALFGVGKRDRAYTTLLMATGLTFGSIAALYGLTNGLITQAQYSQLVTVVILSAFIPTVIAQQFFEPDIEAVMGAQEAAGEEDLVGLRRPHGRSPERAADRQLSRPGADEDGTEHALD